MMTNRTGGSIVVIARKQTLRSSGHISKGTYGTVYEQEDERRALKASLSIVLDVNGSGGDGRDKEDCSVADATDDYALARDDLIEAMILKRATECANGENIVRLHKIFFDSFIGGSQHPLVLQLDLAQCSLYDFVQERPERVKQLDVRQRIMQSLVDALSFLHNELGMVHGDLKCANVLIKDIGTESWSCQLADFGLSSSPLFATHGHAATTFTFARRAPELFDDLKQQPFLLLSTPEAFQTLLNRSCFDDPVISEQKLSSELLAQVKTDETGQNCFQTPPKAAVSSVPSPSTPDTLLYCDETLLASPVHAICPTDSSTAAAALCQASSKRHSRVTRALFASDVWGLGSLFLNLLTLGKHPVHNCSEFWTFYDKKSANNHRRLESAAEDLQCGRRAQLYYWYNLLAEHQHSSDDGWRCLFDFDAIVRHFETTIVPLAGQRRLPRLASIETISAHIESTTTQEIDFLLACLQFDPSARPAVKQLRAQPYLNVCSSGGDNSDRENDSGSSSTNNNNESGSKKRKKSDVTADRDDNQSKRARVGGETQQQMPETTSWLHLALAHVKGGCASAEILRFRDLVQFVFDICEHFKFCCKTALLSVAYICITHEKVLEANLRTNDAYRDCHVAACVLLAGTLYENRHADSFDELCLSEQYGDSHGFTGADLADLQRRTVEALEFNFNVATFAVLIDEALRASKCGGDSDHLVDRDAKNQLLLDVARVAPLERFSAPQHAVSTALALLRHHGFTNAHDVLLSASGRTLLASDYALRQLERIVASAYISSDR